MATSLIVDSHSNENSNNNNKLATINKSHSAFNLNLNFASLRKYLNHFISSTLKIQIFSYYRRSDQQSDSTTATSIATNTKRATNSRSLQHATKKTINRKLHNNRKNREHNL